MGKDASDTQLPGLKQSPSNKVSLLVFRNSLVCPRLPLLPQVVYDRRAIFVRYARQWLIVDLLAAFPFTFIPGLGPDDKHGNHEISYFLTLPKVFQLYELMNVVQEYHKIHQGAFLGIRTLLSITVVSLSGDDLASIVHWKTVFKSPRHFVFNRSFKENDPPMRCRYFHPSSVLPS